MHPKTQLILNPVTTGVAFGTVETSGNQLRFEPLSAGLSELMTHFRFPCKTFVTYSGKAWNVSSAGLYEVESINALKLGIEK
jgi:hypothetical protein